MYPIPMAILMMFLRWGVEKFIFRPIGLQVGMKDSRKSYPRSNPTLEAEFRKSKNLTQTTTENLAKATSMSQLEVNQGLEIPSVGKDLVFRSSVGSDKGNQPSSPQLYRSSAKQAGGNLSLLSGLQLRNWHLDTIMRGLICRDHEL